MKFNGSFILCLLLFVGCAGNPKPVEKTDPEKKDTTVETEETKATEETEVLTPKHKPGLKNYDGVWYFGSTSPNANKATPLYEYFKLVFEGDTIHGVGFGDWMQGSEPWSIAMNGVFVSKNKINMKLSYTQEGYQPFASEETWEMVLDDYGVYRLYRKAWKKKASEISAGGADEYAEETLEFIPEFYREKLK